MIPIFRINPTKAFISFSVTVPEPRMRFEGTTITQKLGVNVRLFYHQLEDL